MSSPDSVGSIESGDGGRRRRRTWNKKQDVVITLPPFEVRAHFGRARLYPQVNAQSIPSLEQAQPRRRPPPPPPPPPQQEQQELSITHPESSLHSGKISVMEQGSFSQPWAVTMMKDEDDVVLTSSSSKLKDAIPFVETALLRIEFGSDEEAFEAFISAAFQMVQKLEQDQRILVDSYLFDDYRHRDVEVVNIVLRSVLLISATLTKSDLRALVGDKELASLQMRFRNWAHLFFYLDCRSIAYLCKINETTSASRVSLSNGLCIESGISRIIQDTDIDRERETPLEKAIVEAMLNMIGIRFVGMSKFSEGKKSRKDSDRPPMTQLLFCDEEKLDVNEIFPVVLILLVMWQHGKQSFLSWLQSTISFSFFHDEFNRRLLWSIGYCVKQLIENKIMSSDYSSDVLPIFFLAWLSILNENMHSCNSYSMTSMEVFEVVQSILDFNKTQILKFKDSTETQNTKALVAQLLSHRLLIFSLGSKNDPIAKCNIQSLIEVVEEMVDRLYFMVEDKGNFVAGEDPEVVTSTFL